MAVTDILQSPIKLWVSAVGTALPNINTIAVGASWGAGWTDCGMTLNALSMKKSDDVADIDVEQYTFPVKEVRTKETIQLETSLAELTAANLKLALGTANTIATVAAGASVHASDSLDFGGESQLPQYQFGFEGYVFDASNNKMPKRFFFYVCVPGIGGSLEFTKKAAAGIPLRINCLGDTTKTSGAQIGKAQLVTGWKTS